MLLSEVFTKDLIKINLEAEDKDEAFEELVDFFCTVRNSNAREEILKSLRERERLMSTGIKPGVAIPHGKLLFLDEIQGICGVSKKGVEYDALDGQPVHLIFMILVPGETDKHLKALKNLAELLLNPQFYIDLCSRKNVEGVYNTLKEYEDHFIEMM
ncbi:MAG: PTS sugar transporter subunit IIA [Treponema sp.]|jgi:PTS system fructose-specific IIC component/PTS system nitrogen regulatory IIA component|nr:PTS sugar transporter subunit IIA [Treponema sp.]